MDWVLPLAPSTKFLFDLFQDTFFKDFYFSVSWFTMFSQFLLYSRVTQSLSHTHIRIYTQIIFPPLSIIFHNKWLDIVPCAIQQGLIAYPNFPFFFSFLGPQPQHIEVPGLGDKLELQLLPYTTATATQNLSHVCDLYHSSWQCWIPNPLSKARDLTHIFTDISWICFLCAIKGTPKFNFWCHLWLLVIWSILFNFHIFVNFLFFLLLLTSGIIPLCLEKKHGMILILVNLLRLCFVTSQTIYPGEYFVCIWK